MKSFIRKLPGFKMINILRYKFSRVKYLLGLFWYDFSRFRIYYTPSDLVNTDKVSLEKWLLQDKHRLEKALSLPAPRSNFGKEVLRRLVSNTTLYSELFGKSEVYYIAVGSLKSYKDFHKKSKVEIEYEINAIIEEIPNSDFEHEICNSVGLRPKVKIEDTSDSFDSFTSTRSSCRHYADTKISKVDLEKSVKMAIRSPSVCNRQHWKVHIFEGNTKLELLKLQNGNLGFRENIPYIAVITSDLKSFYIPEERTQAFTDGGMFSMSFIYSLHSLGISSCPLNWCVSPINNQKLYQLTGINESESVLMLLAFGYANQDSQNAKSPRLGVENFYTINL